MQTRINACMDGLIGIHKCADIALEEMMDSVVWCVEMFKVSVHTPYTAVNDGACRVLPEEMRYRVRYNLQYCAFSSTFAVIFIM